MAAAKLISVDAAIAVDLGNLDVSPLIVLCECSSEGLSCFSLSGTWFGRNTPSNTTRAVTNGKRYAMANQIGLFEFDSGQSHPSFLVSHSLPKHFLWAPDGFIRLIQGV